MDSQTWNQWAGVKLHAVIVCIVALSLYALENPSTTLILGGILCSVTYSVIGIMEGRRAPLWLSPLSFYFLWYAVGLGFSAIYYGIIIAAGDLVPFSVAQVSPEDLAVGYVIFLVGSLALHAGLQVFRPVELDDPSEAEPIPKLVDFGSLVCLWGVGLWILYNPEWMAALGAPGAVFYWTSTAALCSFALLSHKHFRLSRVTFMWALTIGIVGQFAANLMSGSKAYLMLSFLPLVWILITRRPLRWGLPVLGLVLLVFYLAVVAPVATASRKMPLQQGETQASRLITTFLEEWTTTVGSLETSFYREQAEEFLIRQFDPTPAGYFVGEVRTYGYQHGATMAYAMYAFIPRIIWPDKPSVTRGAWFATHIGFSKSEEEATTSLGMTATGELYWNFGIVGVLIGMFTIGCLLGKLWQMAGADPRHRPLSMLLYILIMLGMPNMPEAVTVFVGIVAAFVTFKAAFFTLESLRKPKRTPPVAVTP